MAGSSSNNIFMQEFTKFWCYVKTKDEQIAGIWNFTGLQVDGCDVATTCNLPNYDDVVYTTNIDQSINGNKSFINPLIVPNAIANNQAVNLGQLLSAIPPSGNYIDNQYSSAQSASFWISGTGQVNGQLIVGAVPYSIKNFQEGVQYSPTSANTTTYAASSHQTIASPSTSTNSSYYGSFSEGGTGTSHTFTLVGGHYSDVINRGTSIITLAPAYSAGSPFFNASGTIPTAVGFNIYPQTVTGVTTGLAINQIGNKDSNYFAGNIGVQTNAPSSNIDIRQSTTGPGATIVTNGSSTVIGIVTQFLNTFKIGDTITCSGETHTITAIASNTSLTTGTNWTVNSVLPVPTLLQVNPNITNGTLAPNTYYYKVTALTSFGETSVSNEISSVLSLTGSNQVIWSPLIGALSYNIYRSTTSGVYTTYFNTSNYQNFVDTGTTGTTGTPPISNIALGAAPYTLTGGIIAKFFGNGNINFPKLSSGTPLYNILIDASGNLITGSVPVGVSGSYLSLAGDSQTVTQLPTFSSGLNVQSNITWTNIHQATIQQNSQIGDITLLLPDTTGTIALKSDIPSVTGFVPYSGATDNVNIGVWNMVAGQFSSQSGSNSASLTALQFGVFNSIGVGTQVTSSPTILQYLYNTNSTPANSFTLTTNTFNNTVITGSPLEFQVPLLLTNINGTGTLLLANQTTRPTTPASGNNLLYHTSSGLALLNSSGWQFSLAHGGITVDTELTVADGGGVISVTNSTASTLASISALSVYTGLSTVIEVSDLVRGGTFILVTGTTTPDNGITHPSAIAGTYWQRQINPTIGIKMEWYPIVGDGVTDNRTYFQSAITYANSLGLGIVSISQSGNYFISNTINYASGVRLVCPTNLSYNSNLASPYDPVVLTFGTSGITSTTAMFNVAGCNNIGFDGVVLNGNGGDIAVQGIGIYGGTGTIGVEVSRCKIYNFNYGLDGNGSSNWNIDKVCVIRENNINIRNIQDSKILDSFIVGGHTCGIYLNTGQVQISHCHIEFQRTGTLKTSSSHGIYLDGNANRILISNNVFDRNAGSDIYSEPLSGKRPFAVIITGNHFKRAAWGIDLSTANQMSVKLNSIDGVTATGNSWYGYDYGASNTEGMYSPRKAIDITSCTDVSLRGNNDSAIKSKLDLQGTAAGLTSGSKYTWIASSTLGTPLADSSYYLTMTTAGPNSINPWIDSPDIIEYAGAYLTVGTLGSLTAGQYAWGNVTVATGTTLTFPTLYIRLPADTNPTGVAANTLFAEYQQSSINIDTATTNIQTEAYRDRNGGLVGTAVAASGGTVSFSLHTREIINANYRNVYLLRVFGKEASTGNTQFAQIPFYITKGSATTYPTVTLGPATQLITTNSFTIASSGATGLVISSITTDGLGEVIKINFTNNGANIVTVTTDLPWSSGAGDAILPAAKMPALTGDVSNSAGSLTVSIGSNKVVYSKIQTQVNNTILGNVTGSTAVPAALTAAQVLTMLNAPTFRGSGQAVLSSGTVAVTVAGTTTSSTAFITRVVPSGSSLTIMANAVCTANTVTITADVAAGTINTADNSTYNYFVIN